MDIPKKSPTTELTIQSQTVVIPQPFAAEHVCTANEASVLNQTLGENIRNNLAERIKKTAAEGAEAKSDAGTIQTACQAVVDEYVKVYEFGVRRGGGGARTTDPVEAELMVIAKSKVKAAWIKKGFKLKDLSTGRLTELAKDAISKRPGWREEAERRVEQRAQDATEDFDLDGIEPTEAE